MGEVYCSRSGADIDRLDNAAFRLQLSGVASEAHFTRLTLRFVLSGEQVYEFDGRSVRLAPGAYLIMNHGQEYRTYTATKEGADMAGFAFNPAFTGAYLASVSTSAERLLDNPVSMTPEATPFAEGRFEISPGLIAGLQRIYKSSGSSHTPPDQLRDWYMALLSRMLADQGAWLYRADQLPAGRASTRLELARRLMIAKEYMDDNFRGGISVDDAARAACLSAFHFIRLFKARYGVTPYQYIRSRRLVFARDELLRGEAGIGDTARTAGFEDHSAFSRAFRKTYGTTPTHGRSEPL